VLKKISQLLFGKQAVNAISQINSSAKHARSNYQTHKDYIAREAVLGARILGPIPSGHNREFFCLDRNTWIWHESWQDEAGRHQEFIVNYEVDPTGILKRINGGQFTKLQGQELANFDRAITEYYHQVSRQIYNTEAPALI
jgi:hypothetical protein